MALSNFAIVFIIFIICEDNFQLKDILNYLNVLILRLKIEKQINLVKVYMSTTEVKPHYISKKGYVIDNHLDNENIIWKIKKDLEIEPKQCPGYGPEEGKKFRVYKSNAKKFYVPVHYGLKHIGSIKTKLPFKPKKINVKFASELRPYQKDIVETYMNYVGNDVVGGGIISVGCGRGKTVMALNIISRLKYKTLIIVNTGVLYDQWIERIDQFLPSAKVGLIRGKIIDIEDKDIVIAMVNSISDPRKDKDYPLELFDQFGLVIADECHHLAAAQFSRSLMKHTFPRTLGLTATPKRQDGLTHVFKYFLGEIIYKDDEIQKTEEEIALDHIPDAIVDTINYINYDQNYSKVILNYKKQPNITSMESNIVNFVARTNMIIKVLKAILTKEPNRNVFILSSRRDHVFTLEEKIREKKLAGGSVGVIIGGMSQANIKKSMEKQIIVATYKIAEEGFDCKKLNTIILATPKKNVEQSVGRILRIKKTERKVIPLIINICDMFSSYTKWGADRNRYFKKKKYEINYYNYSKEETYKKSDKNMDDKDKYYKLNMQKITSITVDNYKRDYSSQKFRNNNGIDKYLKSCDFDDFGGKNVKYEVEMD